MLDKHSLLLLKIVAEEKLTVKEYSILSDEFNLCLRKASENRIEFFFLKKIKSSYPKLFEKYNLGKVYKEGERKISIFQKTAVLLENTLARENCVFFKTYYPFPAILSDIDILFFEKGGYDRFVKIMQEKGFLYKEDDALKGSLKKQGFIKCEPHSDVSWYGMHFVSKDFIKRNLTKKKIGQSTIIIPNNKAAFVISTAHILFDCQYLSLRDYLLLKEFATDKEITGDCIKEAEKFGWGKAAVYIIDILKKGEKLSFPFWIPLEKVYVFFKDKRKKHFSTEDILMPFIYYFWKKIRSKLSRRIYRNSWLY